MRRALLAATALALVPLSPTQAAAPVCRADYVDPVGDAQGPSTGLHKPPPTPGVDIQRASIVTDGERLTASVTVGDIRLQPPSSTSTRIAFEFTLLRQVYRMFYVVQLVPEPAASDIDWTRGIQTDEREVLTDRVDVTVVGDTVTMSVTYDELERIRGREVTGQRLTAVDVSTTITYIPDLRAGFYPHQDYDHVEQVAGLTRYLGRPCPKR